MSLIAGKRVVILFLNMVNLLTKQVRSLSVFWNDTCDCSFLQYPVCVSMLSVCSCMSVNCRLSWGGNFSEKEQRRKICFRWHPPKDCFYSFSCSHLRPSPSIKFTLCLKTLYTFERDLNIEASGCELFRDLVSSLLPCIIPHHCHSTLLMLPTQS